MKHKKVILLFSIFYFLFSGMPVFASTIFFEQRGAAVDVFLNTEGQYINAFEGSLTFDGNALLVQKIQDAGSVVNFWIEKPEHTGAQIHFSGITPGGYLGNRGLLFSADFSIIKESDLGFGIQNPLFLKNDGLGTADAVTVVPFTAQAINMVPGLWYQNIWMWVIIVVAILLSVLAFTLWQRKHF